MSAAAVVHRGPIRVVLTEPPLEPPEELRKRVDELWEQERALRTGLVDGTMLSVSAIQDDCVVTRPCAYRLFVARERDRALRGRLGVRALGVSGIALVGGGDGGVSVLLGRRAIGVTEYGGAWELVPSGGVDPRSAGPDGVVDANAALLSELEEEAGIRADAVVDTTALGLVHDLAQDGFDVCFALQLPDAAVVRPAEYEETMLLPATKAAEWLGRPENPTVPTSLAILELAREVRLVR